MSIEKKIVLKDEISEKDIDNERLDLDQLEGVAGGVVICSSGPNDGSTAPGNQEGFFFDSGHETEFNNKLNK